MEFHSSIRPSAEPKFFDTEAIARGCNLKSCALTSITVLALLMILGSLTLLAADKKSAKPNLTVLYTFLGEEDGASPNEVTLDPADNLYGMSFAGGDLVDCFSIGCGVVFKVDTRGHETALYAFTGQDGVANPFFGVLRDNLGALYGTVPPDEISSDGIAFKLTVPPGRCVTALCPWDETVLYTFGANGRDGSLPEGDLIQDTVGNLYGATAVGGGITGCHATGCGTVFKLDSEGKETILYRFAGPPTDGAYPEGPLLLDEAGNLYGTTEGGGTDNNGTVFELTPTGSGWSEKVLYSFTGGSDGSAPLAGLISDGQANLYGTAYEGGTGSGVVFQLTPKGSGWAETVLHSFAGAPDGAYPEAKLLRDGLGNLYGTTSGGGIVGSCPFGQPGCGTVFELSPKGSGWTESILWSFTGGTDGSIPLGPVIMDEHGNLYGAAFAGGDLGATNPVCESGNPPAPIGCGTVFKLTP